MAHSLAAVQAFVQPLSGSVVLGCARAVCVDQEVGVHKDHRSLPVRCLDLIQDIGDAVQVRQKNSGRCLLLAYCNARVAAGA
jgi:hypothetical protein